MYKETSAINDLNPINKHFNYFRKVVKKQFALLLTGSNLTSGKDGGSLKIKDICKPM